MHLNVPVSDGYFSVHLGQCDEVGGCTADVALWSFPTDLPEQMWVGLVVDGVALQMRQAVGSAPFALRAESAGNCDHLGGNDVVALQQVLAGMCGGIECPLLEGYVTTCNAQNHCEYTWWDPSGWRKWDVWIYIAPGSFDMQHGKSGAHDVTLSDGFFISKYEIVVEQYEACHVDAPSLCPAPATGSWDGDGWGPNEISERPEHPQNGLTFQKAKGFCEWAAPEGRLPYEAEWEYAAGGPQNRKYPWGQKPTPTCENGTAVFGGSNAGNLPWGCYTCMTPGCGGTQPVGTRPAGASWCGALGMGGNVSEWCEDCWHEDLENGPDGVAAPPCWDCGGAVCESNWRVVRSGTFKSGYSYSGTKWRSHAPATWASAAVGARCVRPVQ